MRGPRGPQQRSLCPAVSRAQADPCWLQRWGSPSPFLDAALVPCLPKGCLPRLLACRLSFLCSSKLSPSHASPTFSNLFGFRVLISFSLNAQRSPFLPRCGFRARLAVTSLFQQAKRSLYSACCWLQSHLPSLPLSQTALPPRFSTLPALRYCRLTKLSASARRRDTLVRTPLPGSQL